MSDPLIQHVSDTAFWVAHFRLQEGLRSRPLFRDPLAGVLAGEHGAAIAKEMGAQRAMEWTMAIRTYVIDTLIREQIAAGVELIINLGAGLDTRPYRMDLPPNLQWIEVDFPSVITFKEEKLRQEKPRCQLQRIPLDLSERTARRELFSRLNAATRKALVITEGVVIYLTEEQVGYLAEDLHEQPHFAFWITDYFSRVFLRLMREGRIRHKLPDRAPFQFNPENWENFYRQRGWKLEKMQYLAEVGAQLKRPMPMPFFAKIMTRLMSEKKRHFVRQMTGYALLKRIDSAD